MQTASDNKMLHEIIAAINDIKQKICCSDTFFDSYNDVVNRIIPDINSRVEEYVADKLNTAKSTVITQVINGIDWENMRVTLLTSVKNSRPVNNRAMLWVDINMISDNDIDAFDDSDIICMYDNYDENSLKTFVRHRKAFSQYVDNYLKELVDFDMTVNNWIDKTTSLMISENVNSLVEHHYAHVVEMMGLNSKKNKKDSGSQKKSKKQSVQQPVQQQQPTDVKKTITLNGICVEMVSSQQEFIKTTVKNIINGM